MGFSIGSFFKSIAAPLIGIAGTALGFPIAGPLVGAAVGKAFAARPAQAAPKGIPQLLGSSVGPSAGGFRAGTIARGIAGAALGVLTIAELLQLSRDNTGKKVTRQKIADAVKHCGITLAAEMFGLTEAEICEIVISKRRRRGRGISAADMRRTRSTIRKVHNITHDLQALVPRVKRHHRARA